MRLGHFTQAPYIWVLLTYLLLFGIPGLNRRHISFQQRPTIQISGSPIAAVLQNFTRKEIAMRTEASRRQALGAMLTASIFGTTAWAAESPSDAEYSKLAAAPKSPADHRRLAKHYPAIAREQEAQANVLNALATKYKTGLPGVTDGQAHELSRTVQHAAEHARDFAEALNDIAEVHEGIAQGPVDLGA